MRSQNGKSDKKPAEFFTFGPFGSYSTFDKYDESISFNDGVKKLIEKLCESEAVMDEDIEEFEGMLLCDAVVDKNDEKERSAYFNTIRAKWF